MRRATAAARVAVQVTVRSGAAGAVALATHTAVNALLLRAPGASVPVRERVTVILPVRDEAQRVRTCLTALLASRDVPDLEVLAYDDRSSDGTGGILRELSARDGRLRILTGPEPAAGWLGKPHACARAARHATGSVLVFVDADVTVAPDGLARAVGLLRGTGLDLVSPYPRQVAVTVAERLVQPLLQWSWLALLPLRAAERSARPSLTAANGQFLCVDAAAYVRSGGHAAVRGAVLDDLALLRAVKRAGGRGVVADGTELAVTWMYDGWPALRDGYAKSLWAAGGHPAASAGQLALLGWIFVVPAVATVRGSRAGLVGWLAGVVSRVIAARRTGGRCWPDVVAHPLSVCLLGHLTALSWWRRRRGTARWKGRPLAPARPGQADRPAQAEQLTQAERPVRPYIGSGTWRRSWWSERVSAASRQRPDSPPPGTGSPSARPPTAWAGSSAGTNATATGSTPVRPC